MARLGQFSADELHRRAGLRDSIFRGLGITFAVHGPPEGIERTWPIDLVPRIISVEEWETIETTGDTQGVRSHAWLRSPYRATGGGHSTRPTGSRAGSATSRSGTGATTTKYLRLRGTHAGPEESSLDVRVAVYEGQAQQ
jgi:hypothetical protein